MLTLRQKKILKYLLDHHEFTSTKTLAARYNISLRSILNDLDKIENFSMNQGIRVERNKKEGIALHYSKDPITLPELNDRKEDLLPKYTANERAYEIILSFLKSSKPVSTTALADKLNTTKRTMNEDMKKIRTVLDKHNLSLEYVTNKGFILLGEETSRRNLIKDIWTQWKITGSEHDISYALPLFDTSNEELQKIREIVFDITSLHSYTEQSLEGLIFHIAISIQRWHQKFTIDMPWQELEALKKHAEYALAETIKTHVEKAFKIDLPQAEIGFLTLHLLGAKQLSSSKNEQDQEADFILKNQIQQFIQHIERQLAVDLAKDEKLQQGLFIHLKPALHRMKFGLLSQNPFLQEINDQYATLKNAVEHATPMLEHAFSTKFNEDEVGYIVLHIGAAVKRLQNNKTAPVRAALVCGTGIGTAHLLDQNIKDTFSNVEIIEHFSFSQAISESATTNDIDLLISTIPLHDVGIPWVQVTPFLNEQDKEKLVVKLNTVTIQASNRQYSSTKSSLQEITHVSTESLQLKASNWEEAVKNAGEILVNADAVSSSYIERTINMVRQHGPYIVIDKGLAMPHAPSDKDVYQTAIAIARLQTPVQFNHDSNDPVSLILFLASKNGREHLQALYQFRFLWQDQTYRNILLTGTLNEINNILNLAEQVT
ncbi:BglG family transcription antiterminator [Marinococcus halotolerans]|uniref:BglG family transcription antiterminator n=1 Tax=Marinococcus halotolerans TaxID=301092 RepID=UPI0003B765DD|nr:BglG family transcription antiterminator [Marinococcus halotolerans]